MKKKIYLLTKMKEYEKEHNRKKLLDLMNSLKNDTGIYTLDYPVCILTMNNRKPSTLDILDLLGDTEIHVFIYDWQEDMYRWLDRPNVTKHFVHKEYLTAQKMRVFIQNFMGEKIYWQLDDDCGKKIIMFENKETQPLGLAMRMIEELSKEYFPQNYGAIGLNAAEMSTKWWNGNIISNAIVASFGLFNMPLLLQHNIRYTGDTEINEDTEIQTLAAEDGIKFGTVNWLCAIFFIKLGGKGSLASTPEKIKTYQMHFYEKYGEIAKFKNYRAKNRADELDMKIKYTWFGKHPKGYREWNEIPLEYAHNKDYENFKRYFKNKLANK